MPRRFTESKADRAARIEQTHKIIQGAAEEAGKASLERAKDTIRRHCEMLASQIRYVCEDQRLDVSSTTVEELLQVLEKQACQT